MIEDFKAKNPWQVLELKKRFTDEVLELSKWNNRIAEVYMTAKINKEIRKKLDLQNI
jgi:hypothetical protein